MLILVHLSDFNFRNRNLYFNSLMFFNRENINCISDCAVVFHKLSYNVQFLSIVFETYLTEFTYENLSLVFQIKMTHGPVNSITAVSFMIFSSFHCFLEVKIKQIYQINQIYVFSN